MAEQFSALSEAAGDESPTATFPAPSEEMPKGMYPRSPAESQEMIEQRRASIQEAARRMTEDQALVNQLSNEIAVLNSLRQANGQAPL